MNKQSQECGEKEKKNGKHLNKQLLSIVLVCNFPLRANITTMAVVMRQAREADAAKALLWNVLYMWS